MKSKLKKSILKMGIFFKKILIEITLFILLAALAGHVSVNFWERYVVQDKLAGIKNSLDHLKVTVHNMGFAYDELEQDLRDLARVNPKSSIPSRETSKESCKKRRELDDKILNQLEVLLAKVSDKPRHALIVDKNTGSRPVSARAQAKNATTITRYPVKAAAVGSEPVNPSNFKASRDVNKCINICMLQNCARNCYEDCKSLNRFQKF